MIPENALVAFWLDGNVSIVGRYIKTVEFGGNIYAELEGCFELRIAAVPVQTKVPNLRIGPESEIQIARIVSPGSVVPGVPKIYIPMGHLPFAIIKEGTPEYRALQEISSAIKQAMETNANF